MGHTVKNPLTAALLHDGGHALLAAGIAYFALWFELMVLHLSPASALLLSGTVGWLLPALVQEAIDTRLFTNITKDSVHDFATYAPIFGLSLILTGRFLAGLAILALVAVVEVLFYWNLIRSK